MRKVAAPREEYSMRRQCILSRSVEKYYICTRDARSFIRWDASLMAVFTEYFNGQQVRGKMFQRLS